MNPRYKNNEKQINKSNVDFLIDIKKDMLVRKTLFIKLIKLS